MPLGRTKPYSDGLDYALSCLATPVFIDDCYIISHATSVTDLGDYLFYLYKYGSNNYIGGNVLMEMAIASYLKKHIFILNDIPSESSYVEEIIGLGPIVLRGDLKKLTF